MLTVRLGLSVHVTIRRLALPCKQSQNGTGFQRLRVEHSLFEFHDAGSTSGNVVQSNLRAVAIIYFQYGIFAAQVGGCSKWRAAHGDLEANLLMNWQFRFGHFGFQLSQDAQPLFLRRGNVRFGEFEFAFTKFAEQLQKFPTGAELLKVPEAD